jgi:hypothetical protein
MYQQRIQEKLQEITESRQKYRKYKAITLKKKLEIWDIEIKLIVQQKNLAHKKYFQTKTIDNENE